MVFIYFVAVTSRNEFINAYIRPTIATIAKVEKKSIDFLPKLIIIIAIQLKFIYTCDFKQ